MKSHDEFKEFYSEELFAELEEEYRYIADFRLLDDRYVHLFLMIEP